MRERFRAVVRLLKEIVVTLKASFLVSLTPIIVLSVLGIYGRLSVTEIFVCIAGSIILACIFVQPYIRDLSALTHYVEQLAKDRKAHAPALSFLSNVAQLSSEVHKLSISWEKRRLQLEAMLIESKILFDILPDLLLMVDEDFRIIRANNSANSAFQRNLVHKKLEDIAPDSPFMNFASWVMHARKGKSFELYIPSIERHYMVQIERFPVHSPARIALIITMHDMTESKHTEQMFADFVANASHEIRTPLTSLIGFIETLRTIGKDDPEAQEHFLGIMADQAGRMSQLIRDLLSLSKIEMRASTPPTEHVQLATIIDTVLKQTEWYAKERNVLVETTIETGLPPILGDTNELIQLFTNLVENAVKYGNADSTIYVTAKQVHMVPRDAEHVREAKRVIAISVQDQGEGIEAEHISRLTERFYRVDSARSRKNKIGGTGLGLSIVKQIIKRHQGDLHIESTVGAGSTFTVYFSCDV